ncbi:MAG: hypothetical protein AB1791_15970 [Chloroflexota bacterium]
MKGKVWIPITLILILVACAAPVVDTPAAQPTAAVQQDTHTDVAVHPQSETVNVVLPESSSIRPDEALLRARFKEAKQQLILVDPRTGKDLAAFPPLEIGRDFFHALSPDGRTLAVIVYSNDYRSHGTLKLVDLRAWQVGPEITRLVSWSETMAFSADGAYLAVAAANAPQGEFGRPQSYQLAIVDVAGQAVVAQIEVAFRPRLMAFTADGESLMTYGGGLELLDDGRPQPAQVALLRAADLSVIWQQELAGLFDGHYEQRPAEPSDVDIYIVGWTPAVTWSADGTRLYVVHADEDRLTTIDFTARTVQTVEVRPKLSWLERLLALTADVVYAKVYNGANAQAVLSADGTRLFVVGGSYETTRYENEEWQYQETRLGLQVIEVATGVEVGRLATEATDIVASADGAQLYLRGWEHDLPWTDVLDPSTLTVVTRVQGMRLVPAHLFGGQPILLATGYYYPSGKTTLSVVDPSTFATISQWEMNVHGQVLSGSW